MATTTATASRRQRALLIGLNYPLDPTARLAGCCNDVRNMAKYLINVCKFAPSQVQVVADEDLARNMARVTKDGIMDSIWRLCLASWRENLELVVFHYSGHGAQQQDASGDELDRMDEGLVPVDFRVRGLIDDDWLLSVFSQFNPKTKIVCFVDACHSGSMLDLSFAYDLKKAASNGQVATTPSTSVTSTGPKIYCLSGCMESETSADAPDPWTRMPSGAMTACLLKLLGDKGAAPYPVLQLQEDINKLLKSLGFPQRPLLTSSTPVAATDVLL